MRVGIGRSGFGGRVERVERVERAGIKGVIEGLIERLIDRDLDGLIDRVDKVDVYPHTSASERGCLMNKPK